MAYFSCDTRHQCPTFRVSKEKVLHMRHTYCTPSTDYYYTRVLNINITAF